MSAVTLKVQKEMDLEDFQDHMLWAGALTYPWWVTCDHDSEGMTLVWYKNLDYNTLTESARLTWQELADACSELAATHSLVAEQLVNDDFDADGSDCVLQYAFIGEIRYG